jgi:cysteine desulfurase
MIYLDNAATTKVDDRVVEVVSMAQKEYFGNPSSQHQLGLAAREKIEMAREKIAKFIGAEVEEIVFTSGGTESNNFAFKGLALANPNKKHIIVSAIEHPAILETCKALEKQGYRIDYVGVNEMGIVDPAEIGKKIKKDTLLVSVMHVNNEIGTIQPIEKIGEICKEKAVYFHSDAVQSFKKLDLDVSKINIDLMSISGHKIHAPKGIGFLYIRLGTRIKPFIDGGGQEMKLRSGTENVPGIMGLAEAIDLEENSKPIWEIRDWMIDEILKIPGTKLNGSRDKRIFHNINVSFYGIEGEGLMLMLDEEGILVSTGSACSSKKLEESHVLKAMGVEEMYLQGNIRLTLGPDITKKDAKFVIEKIKEKIKKLREISPFKLNSEEIVNEKN